MKIYYPLKYRRNEYAKLIRKDYESHKIKERRCNLREWTIEKSGRVHSLTTVFKDFGYLLEINSIH